MIKTVTKALLCIAAFAAAAFSQATADYSAFDAKFPGVRKDVQNSVKYSVNYSPYTGAYTPTGGPVPPVSLIRTHLEQIAQNFDFIRTFTVDRRLMSIYDIAHELELKVIGTAWIDGGMREAQIIEQLDTLISLANAGKVVIASVGSEALVRNDVTPAKLLEYVNYVKAGITAPVPVTYMDVTAMFNSRGNAALNALNDACDLILFSHYPVFSNNYNNSQIINGNGGVIPYAIAELRNAYRDVKNAQGANKPVILAETGWPTAGPTWIGSAQPTPENARGYWDVVQAWAKSSNVNVVWFNSYDEEWKPVEGVLNANNWGLFYGDGNVKEAFEDVFTGQTSAVSFNDRVILHDNQGSDVAIIAPGNTLTALFTAGPNPTNRSLGMITFFRQGNRVDAGVLTIFDAFGNVVNKICIDDNGNRGGGLRRDAMHCVSTIPATIPATIPTTITTTIPATVTTTTTAPRRVIGTWDLTDTRGRPVPEGTYAAKGVLKTPDGKTEKVSVVIGVR